MGLVVAVGVEVSVALFLAPFTMPVTKTLGVTVSKTSLGRLAVPRRPLVTSSLEILMTVVLVPDTYDDS